MPENSGGNLAQYEAWVKNTIVLLFFLTILFYSNLHSHCQFLGKLDGEEQF